MTKRRSARPALFRAALPLFALLGAAGTGGGPAEPAASPTDAIDAIGPIAATAAAEPARPNVVLILTDDQDLALGSLRSMPRLRALIGDEGTTFSNHFVSLSLCCPSRATILRGQYAHNHKVYTNIVADGSYVKFHARGSSARPSRPRSTTPATAPRCSAST